MWDTVGPILFVSYGISLGMTRKHVTCDYTYNTKQVFKKFLPAALISSLTAASGSAFFWLVLRVGEQQRDGLVPTGPRTTIEANTDCPHSPEWVSSTERFRCCSGAE